MLARFPCMCTAKSSTVQNVTRDFMCGRHGDVSDSCLCVQMPFHMHALFWLCLVPSPSFSHIEFGAKAPQNRQGFQHPASIKAFQFRAAAAAWWTHQCSVTSGSGLLRDLVTLDSFKASAPPLIRFPEPPSFLCLPP